jgi:hypothetical protein
MAARAQAAHDVPHRHGDAIDLGQIRFRHDRHPQRAEAEGLRRNTGCTVHGADDPRQ